MKRDNIFEKPIEKQFEFDEQVAAVFDDMIERSVPFYRKNIELIVDILLRRIKDGMHIVDLGSSTGSMLIELSRRCKKQVTFTGIDRAQAMVELAQKKAKAFNVNVNFICDDILKTDFSGADIIISNYTLQFIRPIVRKDAVQKIYDSLNSGGLFICSEKILMQNSWLNKQIIDIYYDYKEQQGYTKSEIIQKREALENVLIPYTIEENFLMFKSCGFNSCDTVFQWGNFATITAFKS
jgi:tRNA (cmo5U34)-methyltransferase